MSTRSRLRSAVLAWALLPLGACLVVHENVTYGKGKSLYRGYVVEYVDATPAPGSLLREGSHVTLNIRVRYSLLKADRGVLKLQFEDEASVPMLDGAVVGKPIQRVSSDVAELSYEFTVPQKHSLAMVACVFLEPEGEREVGGELRLRYPIAGPK